MSEKEKQWYKEGHFIIMLIVRIVLIFAFIGALSNQRHLVLFVSALAFLITFLPYILKSRFGIEIPAGFEVIVLLFLYGALYFGEVRGFYAEFWWWGLVLNMAASIALGFVGFIILYALYKDEKIEASPVIVSLFAFCFSLAAGTLWEVFEYSVDNLFGFNLQSASINETMKGIVVNVIGAFVISGGGYLYIKSGKRSMINYLISSFVDRNAKIFGKREKVHEKIHKLIQEGEGEKLEFKSTLRKNLHTGEADRKMELANLKTLVAYLNSSGGTLLIGVNDSGEIIGIEPEGFPNKDKIWLHFTNLIRWHIGNEYLPFINLEVLELDGKHVLKVECKSSDKPVFLKVDSDEEFYIRNGPSSSKLWGSALIDYVARRFIND